MKNNKKGKNLKGQIRILSVFIILFLSVSVFLFFYFSMKRNNIDELSEILNNQKTLSSEILNLGLFYYKNELYLSSDNIETLKNIIKKIKDKNEISETKINELNIDFKTNKLDEIIKITAALIKNESNHLDYNKILDINLRFYKDLQIIEKQNLNLLSKTTNLMRIIVIVACFVFLALFIFSYLGIVQPIRKRLNHEKKTSHELLKSEKRLKELMTQIENQKQILNEEKDKLKIYETVIEQSPVTILFTNNKKEIVYTNPHFEELTKFKKDEVIGKNPKILNSGKTPLQTYSDLWKTLNNNEIWKGEFINKKKNGEIFIERAIISPIINSKGEITHYCAIKEDVTKQKAIEKEINDINKSLLESIKTTKKQKEIIEAAHREMKSGILYALNIQQALLPSTEITNKLLNEHFIIFKPKETVSGDFYFVANINEELIIATADCTGHGVAGAFMMMISVSFLNEIINKDKTIQPSEILEKLRKKIKNIFSQFGQKSNSGLDIAVYNINQRTNTLKYSGAFNPIWIIRDGELNELKPTRTPIGNHPIEREFTTTEFKLEQNDSIYSFSDGYHDQLGGERGRRFSKKRFKDLILDVNKHPVNQQKYILNETLNSWKKENEQTDDITVLGVKWENTV